MVMDLDFFAHHRPTPSTPWVVPVTALTTSLFRLRGVRVRFEGHRGPGAERAIFACNATHQFDLVPIRWLFHKAGHPVVTLSKGKNYHGLLMRTFCTELGSVPLVSRGYIIAMDFEAVHQRRPTNEEYRALRDHVNDDTPLPPLPALRAMATTHRSVLGHPFDGSCTYAEAVRTLYRDMMTRTLALCRQANSQGHDLQMFPQGSSSQRLSRGHIGAVQLAHALGQPLVPVGVNGCLDVFPRRRSIRMARGEIVLRVGEPWVPPLQELPAGFRPFHPDDEAKHRQVLDAATAGLMERINALLDPRYQWSKDRQSDGAQGVKRFV